ncbi:DUF1617 family protein [Streptococcus sp. ZY19097]|uniref:DUF1617 family protein n=1 Tax=Streptococcus sp. ZY19097 TaxID=3231906 RepID=UPI0034573D26
MQLKLTNKDLLTLKTILEKLHISNMRINRGKIKLYKHVLAKIDEYAQDERDILSAAAVIDDDGSFAKNNDGNVILKEGETYEHVNNQLNELSQEEVVLDAGEYEARYTVFWEWLAECEEELTMDEVTLVDDLLEQFEKQKENNYGFRNN